MPTLSFQCPKCSKIHDRIRQEMAGFKVRCQCGFVFRLGPKDAKDKIAFKEKLDRRKKRKSERAARKNREAGKLPDVADQISGHSPALARPFQSKSNNPLDGLSVPSERPLEKFDDDILQAIPEDPFEPVGPTHATTEIAGVRSDANRFDPGSFVEIIDDDEEVLEAIPMDDPLMDLPMAELPVNPPRLPARRSSESSPPRSRTKRAVRRTANRKSSTDKTSFSMGGPIWTLVLAVFGTMFMFVTLFYLGIRIAQTAYQFGNVHPALVGLVLTLNVLTFLMALLTTIFLMIAGILAAMELSEKTYKPWAILWAGRSAIALLGCYLTGSIFRALGVARLLAENVEIEKVSANPEVIPIAGLAAILILGWYVAACSVPLAIAITGFVRNR